MHSPTWMRKMSLHLESDIKTPPRAPPPPLSSAPWRNLEANAKRAWRHHLFKLEALAVYRPSHEAYHAPWQPDPLWEEWRRVALAEEPDQKENEIPDV
ncbi:hypothetical protein CDD81_3447 [Ophiocordyceps australis]|uniref:Uncharacterized protein n=1 Tax=Ophiocordyceps australis TaxID=1399860 RepID=A0A2C5XAQ6_9HYPO|nr:hypothetical protein CDD81_3447 [Ophiocordyceps australis]